MQEDWVGYMQILCDFYINDLSICRFYCPRRVLEPVSHGYRGMSACDFFPLYSVNVIYYIKWFSSVNQPHTPGSNPTCGSSPCGSAEANLTSINEDAGLIPGLAQWVKVLELL